MRKIINSTYITMDGAVENPHLWPSLGDSGREESYQVQMELLNECDAVLMGRHTYASFASAWPTRSGDAMSDRMNSIQKLVVSATLRDPTWNNTQVLGRDAIAKLGALKSQPGKHIVQYGLGAVSFELLRQGLLDEVRLWLHPIILGNNGSRAPHFLNCPTMRFDAQSTRSLPNGIVIVNYKCNRID